MPSGSGAHCAVSGCMNNKRNLNIWLDRECVIHLPKTKRECTCPPRFSLHPKPKDDLDSRMWLKNLNLKSPPKALYVCSFHFVDKKPTTEHPYPTLYLGYEAKLPKTRRVLKRVFCPTDHEPKGKLAGQNEVEIY